MVHKLALRLTENIDRALKFAPHAASACADAIEHAGHGAVVRLGMMDGTFKLRIGRVYVSYIHF